MLIRYLEESGVDVCGLARAAGLDEDASAVEAQISADRYRALMEESLRRSGDEQLGLHLGEATGREHGGHLLACMMLNCADLGEALALQCRYHDIVDSQGALLLLIEGGETRLGWQPYSRRRKEHEGFDHQLADWIIAALVAVIGELTSGRAVIREVRFARPAPGDDSEYRRVIRAPLRFGAGADEILLESSSLSIPIALADPGLLAALTGHAERILARLGAAESWAGRVSEQLARLIHARTPSLSEVARELGVSARTLQSRLTEENTQFTRLLDESRRLLALDQLRDSEASLGEIAFMLNFSDQSAFTRATAKPAWGRSPSC
ncbi:MAG: AraC family transcriptional regulator [Deltaproteobacteria bacterium]|nr:AraC family transcriptional regulator [Deltaproteobacteria bacterium]